jgi:hypothetical protein
VGWCPGTRLRLRLRGGLAIVTAEAHGALVVTRNGHLQLPAAVRRGCAVAAGDRVLLAGEPAEGVLIVWGSKIRFGL